MNVPTLRRAPFKPFLTAAIVLASLSAITLDPETSRAAIETAETVRGTFAACGPRADSLCVVDGDTFRINQRRVRVVGIDTAEKRARCPEEAALAARSTAALQQWLNRGPFIMTPNPARAVDRYGRELQIVARVGANGAVEALADWMQAEGGARVYDGGARRGWC